MKTDRYFNINGDIAVIEYFDTGALIMRLDNFHILQVQSRFLQILRLLEQGCRGSAIAELVPEMPPEKAWEFLDQLAGAGLLIDNEINSSQD